VEDELVGTGTHTVAVRWHLAESCRVLSLEARRVHIGFPGGSLELEADARMSLEALTASDDPPGGWVSRGYHRRSQSITLIARGETTVGVALITRIRVLLPGGGA
jgi:hypothetical protein